MVQQRTFRFPFLIHLTVLFLLSGCAGILGGGLQSATSDSESSTEAGSTLNSLDEIAQVGNTPGGTGRETSPVGGIPGGTGAGPGPLGPLPGTSPGTVPLPAPFPGTAGATPGYSPPVAGNNPPPSGGTQIGESSHPTGPDGKFCDVTFHLKFATTPQEHQYVCEASEPEPIDEAELEDCGAEGNSDPFGNYQKPNFSQCRRSRAARGVIAAQGPQIRISQPGGTWVWNKVYNMKCLPDEAVWEWKLTFEKLFDHKPGTTDELSPEDFLVQIFYSQNGEWLESASYNVTVTCDSP